MSQVDSKQNLDWTEGGSRRNSVCIVCGSYDSSGIGTRKAFLCLVTWLWVNIQW